MKTHIGIKLLFITLISMLMIAALGIVNSKVHERADYRNAAKHSISKGWSGKQTFLSPIIYASFSTVVDQRQFDGNLKQYVMTKQKRTWHEIIIPDNLLLQGGVKMQERYRGIYRIPVYETELSINGEFSTKRKFDDTLKSLELIIDMSDLRGLVGAQTISLNGKASNFEPGDSSELFGSHLKVDLPLAALDEKLQFSMQSGLRGMDWLNIVPSAKQLSVQMKSDWPHPYFVGNYLPTKRQIGESGFTANWQLSSLATSILGTLGNCVKTQQACQRQLEANSFGVGFHSPIDIYQKTDRALKYGFMFILLTFAIFLLYETIKGLSIHPLQYTLVGSALALFYMLLLSLSEHMGFNNAYLAATLGSLSLIAGYMIVVLGSKPHAILLSVGLGLLYLMLFFILLSEDYALLMGSALIFTTLALIMYTTRNIDWYQIINSDKILNNAEKDSEPAI